MWFHWTGEEFLMGAPPNAPKMKVLDDDREVAFSDRQQRVAVPVLCVRGTASVR